MIRTGGREGWGKEREKERERAVGNGEIGKEQERTKEEKRRGERGERSEKKQTNQQTKIISQTPNEKEKEKRHQESPLPPPTPISHRRAIPHTRTDRIESAEEAARLQESHHTTHSLPTAPLRHRRPPTNPTQVRETTSRKRRGNGTRRIIFVFFKMSLYLLMPLEVGITLFYLPSYFPTNISISPLFPINLFLSFFSRTVSRSSRVLRIVKDI